MREIHAEAKTQLTGEVLKIFENSIEREALFFDRHGIIASQIDEQSPAYGAYLCAVQREQVEGQGRVFLDTPLGRKSFMLGYLVGHKDGEPELEAVDFRDVVRAAEFIDRVSDKSGC